MTDCASDPGWKEIWREDRHDATDPDNYYGDSVAIHDEHQAIRISTAGFVMTRPFSALCAWNRDVAKEYRTLPKDT